MKLTVEELREKLRDLPENAEVCAYEGEGTGIVVKDVLTGKEIAFIETGYA